MGYDDPDVSPISATSNRSSRQDSPAAPPRNGHSKLTRRSSFSASPSSVKSATELTLRYVGELYSNGDSYMGLVLSEKAKGVYVKHGRGRYVFTNQAQKANAALNGHAGSEPGLAVSAAPVNGQTGGTGIMATTYDGEWAYNKFHGVGTLYTVGFTRADGDGRGMEKNGSFNASFFRSSSNNSSLAASPQRNREGDAVSGIMSRLSETLLPTLEDSLVTPGAANSPRKGTGGRAGGLKPVIRSVYKGLWYDGKRLQGCLRYFPDGKLLADDPRSSTVPGQTPVMYVGGFDCVCDTAAAVRSPAATDFSLPLPTAGTGCRKHGSSLVILQRPSGRYAIYHTFFSNCICHYRERIENSDILYLHANEYAQATSGQAPATVRTIQGLDARITKRSIFVNADQEELFPGEALLQAVTAQRASELAHAIEHSKDADAVDFKADKHISQMIRRTRAERNWITKHSTTLPSDNADTAELRAIKNERGKEPESVRSGSAGRNKKRGSHSRERSRRRSHTSQSSSSSSSIPSETEEEDDHRERHEQSRKRIEEDDDVIHRRPRQSVAREVSSHRSRERARSVLVDSVQKREPTGILKKGMRSTSAADNVKNCESRERQYSRNDENPGEMRRQISFVENVNAPRHGGDSADAHYGRRPSLSPSAPNRKQYDPRSRHSSEKYSEELYQSRLSHNDESRYAPPATYRRDNWRAGGRNFSMSDTYEDECQRSGGEIYNRDSSSYCNEGPTEVYCDNYDLYRQPPAPAPPREFSHQYSRVSRVSGMHRPQHSQWAPPQRSYGADMNAAGWEREDYYGYNDGWRNEGIKPEPYREDPFHSSRRGPPPPEMYERYPGPYSDPAVPSQQRDSRSLHPRWDPQENNLQRCGNYLPSHEPPMPTTEYQNNYGYNEPQKKGDWDPHYYNEPPASFDEREYPSRLQQYPPPPPSPPTPPNPAYENARDEPYGGHIDNRVSYYDDNYGYGNYVSPPNGNEWNAPLDNVRDAPPHQFYNEGYMPESSQPMPSRNNWNVYNKPPQAGRSMDPQDNYHGYKQDNYDNTNSLETQQPYCENKMNSAGAPQTFAHAAPQPSQGGARYENHTEVPSSRGSYMSAQAPVVRPDTRAPPPPRLGGVSQSQGSQQLFRAAQPLSRSDSRQAVPFSASGSFPRGPSQRNISASHQGNPTPAQGLPQQQQVPVQHRSSAPPSQPLPLPPQETGADERSSRSSSRARSLSLRLWRGDWCPPGAGIENAGSADADPTHVKQGQQNYNRESNCGQQQNGNSNFVNYRRSRAATEDSCAPPNYGPGGR